jgi:anaerobic selenocysteine-containing dehydrogenase
MSTMLTVKGVCPLDCQDSCAWVAHVEDGRVVRVSGAKEHPVTRGALCAKVKDYETRTYASDRLLHPLIRTGGKGEGEFRQAGWDEALDLVAHRFAEIVESHGAQALLPHSFLGSMGVVQRRALMRLFHVLGASQPIGSVCGQAGNAAAADGHSLGFDPEEMAEAHYALVWGANPLTTCHHNWHFISEARRRHGARIVCIDPVRTRTARAADEHIAVRPGTDWVLAAGIGRILLTEGLADLAYAEAAAFDVDEYAEMVDPWTPEAVATVCDVGADVVLRTARDFGAARPAVLRAGIGVQQSVAGDALVRALSALSIVAGHWQYTGGGLFIESYPDMNDGLAARPDLAPTPTRTLDLGALGNVLTDPDLDPPVQGLMVWGANPATIQRDAGRVREGLTRTDLFTVVVEHFMTDTARFADVVLPSTTQLEHFDVQGAWGHHYISVNLPAVSPVGESRTHGDIMRGLAARMGLDHPALRESDEEIAASALPDGVTLAELKEAGWIKWSPARFSPSGRIRLAGDTPPLPRVAQDGQLQLLTPKPHHFLNSSFANMPRHRAAMKRATLYLHPDDAASRGLTDGDAVQVGNAGGSVHAFVVVTEDVRRGVATLPGRWWSADVGSAGVNALTPDAASPGGQPAYNDTYVTVIRA